jgi:hypothetical protein
MKRTYVAGLVLCGIAALPSAAAEVGILLDKQIGKAQTLGGVVAGGGLPGGNYDAVSPSGVGVRLGYSFLDLKVAEIGMALTYHPKAEGDLVAGPIRGKYSTQYVAVGVQADWKFLVNLHAGLDMRSEKLTATVGNVSDSTTYTRPWVKAGVGFSVPTPVLSPFVRLEVAMPISKEDKTSTNEDFRKAMAPALQVSLYGGIRF